MGLLPFLESRSYFFDADNDFPYYFDEDQLYDLNADIFEQNNLAADPKYADVLLKMKESMCKELVLFPHIFGEFKTE